jgi:outer membrane lipopolysaccharide assembly protein LptE/RlpB
MKYFLALFLIPLTLFGCGYTPVTLGPGIGVKTLFIEPLDNRTAEPFLDSQLTNSLRERFGRDRRLTLVNTRKDAEAILSGSVSSYNRKAVSYDRTDTISEYRSTMTVMASLRRVADGKILWKDNVVWSEESMNSNDRSVQEDYETIAIQEITERLAEQLYNRLQENF